MATTRTRITLADKLAELTPERRAAVEAEGARVAAQERTLREIREGLGITQEQLAEALGVQQSAVSKVERREDHVTLRKLAEQVQGMGGRLVVSVLLPGQAPIHLKVKG